MVRKLSIAYFGRSLEPGGWGIMSASFPYLRNSEYRVSWDNSAACPPGEAGSNSTFNCPLGNRTISSTHGRPRTRNVRTPLKGLNHGLTGFSFRYLRNCLSTSATCTLGPWENLINAPPSFRRGITSWTWIGRSSGNALLVIAAVSEALMLRRSKRLVNRGTAWSTWKKIYPSNELSWRG